jgi:hypothetical protein
MLLSVHSTLQQIDPAPNLKKKWKEQVYYTRDVLLLFCMFALWKDERQLHL